VAHTFFTSDLPARFTCTGSETTDSFAARPTFGKHMQPSGEFGIPPNVRVTHELTCQPTISLVWSTGAIVV
jgi:hypothetical protein